MKKLLILSAFLLFTHSVNSQWIIESFDSSAGVFFKEATPSMSIFFRNYSNIYYEGTGSLGIGYIIEAIHSWGGSAVSKTYSTADSSLPYFDLSKGKSLRFWYRVMGPYNGPGGLYLQFKLLEIDDEGNQELWYQYTNLDFRDNSRQWKSVNMFLEQSINGFTLEVGNGDGVLQLENIRGFELVFLFMYENPGFPPPTAVGAFLMDRLELVYPTAINDEDITPTEFVLKQNYPNPFNPATRIQFTIGSNQFVQLKVYDLIGKEVATLVNEYRDTGSYNVDFDASNLTSGIYLYKLQAGDFIQTKKMLLIK